MSTEGLVGGWTEFRPLTAEDQQVFDQALGGLIGVKYTPLEVAVQIVVGTNYKFRCDALPQVPNPVAFKVIIGIFRDLQDHVILTDIHKEK